MYGHACHILLYTSKLKFCRMAWTSYNICIAMIDDIHFIHPVAYIIYIIHALH